MAWVNPWHMVFRHYLTTNANDTVKYCVYGSFLYSECCRNALSLTAVSLLSYLTYYMNKHIIVKYMTCNKVSLNQSDISTFKALWQIGGDLVVVVVVVVCGGGGGG